MAIVSTHHLSLVMVVVTATLIFTTLQVSALCGGDVADLIDECSQFVKVTGPKMPPSSECCGVVKTFEIPCVCKFVTPNVEKIVSMEKVVYVARTCGLKVEPGMQCGSYTVPPMRMV